MENKFEDVQNIMFENNNTVDGEQEAYYRDMFNSNKANISGEQGKDKVVLLPKAYEMLKKKLIFVVGNAGCGKTYYVIDALKNLKKQSLLVSTQTHFNKNQLFDKLDLRQYPENCCVYAAIRGIIKDGVKKLIPDNITDIFFDELGTLFNSSEYGTDAIIFHSICQTETIDNIYVTYDYKQLNSSPFGFNLLQFVLKKLANLKIDEDITPEERNFRLSQKEMYNRFMLDPINQNWIELFSPNVSIPAAFDFIDKIFDIEFVYLNEDHRFEPGFSQKVIDNPFEFYNPDITWDKIPEYKERGYTILTNTKALRDSIIKAFQKGNALSKELENKIGWNFPKDMNLMAVVNYNRKKGSKIMKNYYSNGDVLQFISCGDSYGNRDKITLKNLTSPVMSNGDPETFTVSVSQFKDDISVPWCYCCQKLQGSSAKNVLFVLEAELKKIIPVNSLYSAATRKEEKFEIACVSPNPDLIAPTDGDVKSYLDKCTSFFCLHKQLKYRFSPVAKQNLTNLKSFLFKHPNFLKSDELKNKTKTDVCRLLLQCVFTPGLEPIFDREDNFCTVIDRLNDDEKRHTTVSIRTISRYLEKLMAAKYPVPDCLEAEKTDTVRGMLEVFYAKRPEDSPAGSSMEVKCITNECSDPPAGSSMEVKCITNECSDPPAGSSMEVKQVADVRGNPLFIGTLRHESDHGGPYRYSVRQSSTNEHVSKFNKSTNYTNITGVSTKNRGNIKNFQERLNSGTFNPNFGRAACESKIAQYKKEQERNLNVLNDTRYHLMYKQGFALAGAGWDEDSTVEIVKNANNKRGNTLPDGHIINIRYGWRDYHQMPPAEKTGGNKNTGAKQTIEGQVELKIPEGIWKPETIEKLKAAVKKIGAEKDTKVITCLNKTFDAFSKRDTSYTGTLEEFNNSCLHLPIYRVLENGKYKYKTNIKPNLFIHTYREVQEKQQWQLKKGVHPDSIKQYAPTLYKSDYVILDLDKKCSLTLMLCKMMDEAGYSNFTKKQNMDINVDEELKKLEGVDEEALLKSKGEDAKKLDKMSRHYIIRKLPEYKEKINDPYSLEKIYTITEQCGLFDVLGGATHRMSYEHVRIDNEKQPYRSYTKEDDVRVREQASEIYGTNYHEFLIYGLLKKMGVDYELCKNLSDDIQKNYDKIVLLDPECEIWSTLYSKAAVLDLLTKKLNLEREEANHLYNKMIKFKGADKLEYPKLSKEIDWEAIKLPTDDDFCFEASLNFIEDGIRGYLGFSSDETVDLGDITCCGTWDSDVPLELKPYRRKYEALVHQKKQKLNCINIAH